MRQVKGRNMKLKYYLSLGDQGGLSKDVTVSMKLKEAGVWAKISGGRRDHGEGIARAKTLWWEGAGWDPGTEKCLVLLVGENGGKAARDPSVRSGGGTMSMGSKCDGKSWGDFKAGDKYVIWVLKGSPG